MLPAQEDTPYLRGTVTCTTRHPPHTHTPHWNDRFWLERNLDVVRGFGVSSLSKTCMIWEIGVKMGKKASLGRGMFLGALTRRHGLSCGDGCLLMWLCHDTAPMLHPPRLKELWLCCSHNKCSKLYCFPWRWEVLILFARDECVTGTRCAVCISRWSPSPERRPCRPATSSASGPASPQTSRTCGRGSNRESSGKGEPCHKPASCHLSMLQKRVKAVFAWSLLPNDTLRGFCRHCVSRFSFLAAQNSIWFVLLEPSCLFKMFILLQN